MSTSRRRRRDSHSSNISDDYPPALLQQLQLMDPSPVQSPINSPTASENSGWMNYGGSSSRGLVYYLIKTQRFSSYVFTGFLGIHFTTTAIIPLVSSFEAADNSLLLTRVLYQARFIEPFLVVGSLSAHIISGITLRTYRRMQQYKKYGRKTVWFKDLNALHWAGYILIPLVAVHAGLARALPLSVAGGSEGIGLGFIGHGFSRFRFFSWSIYSMLVTIGTFHVVKGWTRWLGVSAKLKTASTWVVAGISGAWLASVINISKLGLASGHLGRQYNSVYNVLLKPI